MPLMEKGIRHIAKGKKSIVWDIKIMAGNLCKGKPLAVAVNMDVGYGIFDYKKSEVKK